MQVEIAKTMTPDMLPTLRDDEIECNLRVMCEAGVSLPSTVRSTLTSRHIAKVMERSHIDPMRLDFFGCT